MVLIEPQEGEGNGMTQAGDSVHAVVLVAPSKIGLRTFPRPRIGLDDALLQIEQVAVGDRVAVGAGIACGSCPDCSVGFAQTYTGQCSYGSNVADDVGLPLKDMIWRQIRWQGVLPNRTVATPRRRICWPVTCISSVRWSPTGTHSTMPTMRSMSPGRGRDQGRGVPRRGGAFVKVFP
jgi:hypothetical protein